MNAIELLEKQHRKVEMIFRKLERGRPRSEVVVELADNMAAHMAIEQEIFYPAVVGVDPTLVSESFEEHSLAEVALKRLLATHPSDDAFHARVVAAKELIAHHVEEEEADLFKKVKGAMSRAQLDALGKEMKARFSEAAAAGYHAVFPAGYAKTAADSDRRHMRTTKAKAA